MRGGVGSQIYAIVTSAQLGMPLTAHFPLSPPPFVLRIANGFTCTSWPTVQGTHLLDHFPTLSRELELNPNSPCVYLLSAHSLAHQKVLEIRPHVFPFMIHHRFPTSFYTHHTQKERETNSEQRSDCLLHLSNPSRHNNADKSFLRSLEVTRNSNCQLGVALPARLHLRPTPPPPPSAVACHG